MHVESSCRLPVASILWQPRADAHALTIICKSTYVLTPGESPLADQQDPPCKADDYWNDDARWSLRLASDMAPFKRRADVILVGHAYAPRQQPVASLMARFAVGNLEKSILVYGERAFTHDGTLLDLSRFVMMPLRWENAGGGPDTVNPVGVRADAPSDSRGLLALPNLQLPSAFFTDRARFVEPVGLGPVAPTWPWRRSKLHRHAAGWDHARWNERPLPWDIDAAYFNAAPPDQQVDDLRPDARIMLENLHFEHAHLVTRLALVVPRAVVSWGIGAVQEIPLRCDTLWIDVDRGVCSLTWRGHLLLDHPQRAGHVVVSTQAAPVPTSPTAHHREDVADETLTASLWPITAELPFVPAPPMTSQPSILQSATGTLIVPSSGGKAALPFTGSVGQRSASPPAAKPLPTPAPARGLMPGSSLDTMMLVTPPLASPREALPFGETPTIARPLVRPPVIPLVPEMVPYSAEIAQRTDVRPRSVEVPARMEPPAEPAMIGPLATVEMVSRSEEPEAPTAAPAATPPSAPIAPVEERLPLEVYPIERCAAIAASRARRKADAARILEESELTEALWQKLDKYWGDATQAEIRRGKTALLKAYDAAYVARLEEERGPISIEEYARISVASERGTTALVLAELTLPKGAAMRIERTWVDLLSEDARLAKHFGVAVDAAREAQDA